MSRNLLIFSPETYSGTPLIRSPIGQKNLAVLTGFLQENLWPFGQAAKKSGRNNEVIVLPRWPQVGVSLYN